VSGVAASLTVIVPVKPWRLAKSRLDLGRDARERLARAFALDVVAAVAASPLVGRLVIVSAEAELASEGRRHGAVVLADRPLLTPTPLTAAIEQGRGWALAHRPGAPVVVVPADLPALTTSVFDEVVRRAARFRSAFVPDAAGLGTTIAWSQCARRLRPRYGPNSAARHRAIGSVGLVGADLRARIDVDTRDDLSEARRLGLGPRTTQVVGEIVAIDAS